METGASAPEREDPARTRPLALADFETFITEEQIARRVRELGAEISAATDGEGPLVVVGVLKGCLPFMADLIRALDTEMTCDFLRVSSYEGGTRSTGSVRFDFDLTRTIRGKDVLLVEDIIDTGLTMSFLLRTLSLREPRTLRVATLLDKPMRRVAEVQVDYRGFSIENRFVIGYGLDYEGRYRNLREVMALREDVHRQLREAARTPVQGPQRTGQPGD